MNNCPECKNDFERPRVHKHGEYCSVKCYHRAYRRKKKLNGVGEQQNIFAPTQPTPTPTPTIKPEAPPMKKAEVTIPNTLGENATFIIKMIERDRDRFEESYKEERAARKKIKEEKEKVDKEFAAFKQQTELDKIANAKPTGLAGLNDSPLVNKLLDHIGPALGKLAERLTDPGGAPQLAGNEQPLQFAQWLQTKTPETQTYVLQVLTALTQLPDENILIQKLAQIQQMVLGEYMRATG